MYTITPLTPRAMPCEHRMAGFMWTLYDLITHGANLQQQHLLSCHTHQILMPLQLKHV
jgi:hypothetical protein